jgi:hypothetical protein
MMWMGCDGYGDVYVCGEECNRMKYASAVIELQLMFRQRRRQRRNIDL